MSLKIPQALFIKIEGQKLINKIETEFAFDNIDYKKGSHLVLNHDVDQILTLASDTLEFWTIKHPPSVDNICLLESKKVVWKYYRDYARKVVHLFEGELLKLENAEVKMNNSLKKNVSMVEIFCDYDSYKTVETKIENINRGVENLNCKTIKVKPNEKIKARKFVETSLDNDKSVLCIYHERPDQLEIFGKTKQHVEKAVKEFSQGPLKLTGEGTKGATPNATNTTVFQINADSFTQSGVSGTEPKEKLLSSFIESKSMILQSPDKPNMSIESTGAELKDQHFVRSIKNKGMAETQLPDSNIGSANFSNLLNKPMKFIDGTGADLKEQLFERSIGNKGIAESEMPDSNKTSAKSSKSSIKPNMSTDITDAVLKDQLFTRSIGNKGIAESQLPDSNNASAKSSKSSIKPNVSIDGTDTDLKDQRFTRSTGNKGMAESQLPDSNNASAKSSKSPIKPNMFIDGTDTDLKDLHFTRSVGNKRMADSQMSESKNGSAKSSNHPSEDENMTDMAISSKATTKQYSQIRSGSKFLYQFNLSSLRVSVYQHSIVDVKGVDAIVNAANDIMVHGGGVAYHISKAAGKIMDDEGKDFVSKNGKLRVGENCVTGAGRLPYKGIIHAVGPQWTDYIGIEDRCAEDLYKTIRNTLKAAKGMEFQRIALCAVSAGIYGVPTELCAEMYIKALADFSEEGVGSISDVHFVDINLEILGLVKDAHEKWCRSPANIHFKNAFKYPSATDRRHVSNTSNVQARSQQHAINEFSLVDFMGQSNTTFDGSPVNTFKICGAVTVKVYTGNLLKLDCVDAIVCAVNNKLKGGLAATVEKAAGLSYKQELKNAASRKKRLPEGETIICSAGALRLKKVVHVVVLNPVVKVNSESLNRLKHINQRILQDANLSMIHSIGMPLIGTGLLNSKDDITACSQRFAKDVKEFCSSNLTKLRVEEIHVVNQDVSRTCLLKDAFHSLENPSPGLESVAYKAKSIRGRSENTASGLDTVDINARSIREPSQGQAAVDVQENVKKSFVIGRAAGNTKIQDSITPLDNKSVRCTYFHTCGNNANWSMSCGHVFCSKCKALVEGMDQCVECTENEQTGSTKMTADTGKPDETCPVCLSDFTDPVKLYCSHRICKHCLDQLEKHKPCCPICNTAFGVITGTQPKGTMRHKEIPDRLPGFKSCNAIQIIYDFPCGTQGKEHPKPGRPYKGTQRHAFLPNNREGKTVLKLLQVAFNRRLIFTIGDSRTTGKQNQVTWNDIHHKTAKFGGTENFGYPDPDYLDRVRDELAAKGVTEDCLK